MEKEERRRNIIIKELEVRDGNRRERAEKLLGEIGANVRIMKMKKVGEEREKEREMVVELKEEQNGR